VTTASDPEEIRREIERTQANLSQDVDALTEKVTPRQIVKRRVDRARDRATRLKDKVMGSNPVHASIRPASGQHIGGGISGTASQTADRVSGTASAAASSASGAASSAASTVQGAASSATEAVQDAASTAADRLQEAPQAIRQQARGNPLAAGLIAFGAGWLVSSLLPASRREQELADQAKQVTQEKVQPVAQQVANQVKDNLREPAQQAVESVKSTAQAAGQTVAEQGRSAAQDVQGRAQDATGAVRSSATSS
jgi:Protein of unknown function (DUF3618)